MAELRVVPSPGLRGELYLPGDKSISHRSVMFASIAEGYTVINGFLPGEDTLNTARAMQSLGIGIEGLGSDRMVVHGRGLDGLTEPDGLLDLGNSGTGLRLLAGLLAGQDFFSILTGDQYLRKRPMARIVDPLRRMGAQIDGRGGGKLAPLAIRGAGKKTRAMDFTSPVASAQVKSAVLLAGLYADGTTIVSEPSKSRDHTERLFRFFGVKVEEEGNRVALRGRQPLRASSAVNIPADMSSAAFFLAAACIVPASDLTIRNVGVNPTRTGVIDILRQMGADIAFEGLRDQAGEPVADIRVRYRKLHAAEIGGSLIPRAIDEIPVLAVAASCAEGTTVIRDAAELRVKESDRIAAMAAELRKMGVLINEHPDGMEIQGRESLHAAVCESHGDHRIAMSLAVAGLAAAGETVIRDAQWIETSFPGFEQLLRQAAGPH
ncbi:MAG TPA: 3-phosphoshikimate 1-carboxyvinyltransferase [Nitrospirota bacterium]|nr:3-phosphoshikimate 1-carboxyvinyltransferase [Nitrospirota bacterium]